MKMVEERGVFLDEQADQEDVLKVVVYKHLFVNNLSELHSPGIKHLHCWSCSEVSRLLYQPCTPNISAVASIYKFVMRSTAASARLPNVRVWRIMLP